MHAALRAWRAAYYATQHGSSQGERGSTRVSGLGPLVYAGSVNRLWEERGMEHRPFMPRDRVMQKAWNPQQRGQHGDRRQQHGRLDRPDDIRRDDRNVGFRRFR